MNPDKLFQYLDGKLPSNERAAIEEQLITDPGLQRELKIARQIHERIAANPHASTEVILPSEEGARAGVLGRRIAIAFSVLVALNVGFGLLFIAHRESSKSSLSSVEAVMSRQLRESAENAGARALPAPTLNEFDVSKTMAAEAIPDSVLSIQNSALRAGGTATSALANPDGKMVVIADVPTEKRSDFLLSLAATGFDQSQLDQIAPATQPRQIIRILLAPASVH